MAWLRGIAVRGLLLALLFSSANAFAFCRTSSCELGEEDGTNESGQACERDGLCVTEGKPLHWGSACIDYAVQADGSPKTGLDAAAFQRVAADAFGAWQNVVCPGGGSPRFRARFQGFVSCARREAVCGGAAENVNVLMFHDREWPSGGQGEIGLTTPTGGVSSGLVVDADLELDSADYRFSLDPAEPGSFALSDVLAHEIGHFLGLGHSAETGALMSEQYTDLASSRELLTADDIAAICSAYPPGAPLDCPAPSPPAYDECQLAPGERISCRLASVTHDKQNGCSTSGAVPAEGGPLPLLILLGLLGRRRGRCVQNAISPASRPGC